jgi:hypothetical protein
VYETPLSVSPVPYTTYIISKETRYFRFAYHGNQVMGNMGKTALVIQMQEGLEGGRRRRRTAGGSNGDPRVFVLDL